MLACFAARRSGRCYPGTAELAASTSPAGCCRPRRRGRSDPSSSRFRQGRGGLADLLQRSPDRPCGLATCAGRLLSSLESVLAGIFCFVALTRCRGLLSGCGALGFRLFSHVRVPPVVVWFQLVHTRFWVGVNIEDVAPERVLSGGRCARELQVRERRALLYDNATALHCARAFQRRQQQRGRCLRIGEPLAEEPRLGSH
jgi:hypothetical protein